QTPTASASTSTSPSPGSGSGRSSTTRAESAFPALTTRPRIPLRVVARRGRRSELARLAKRLAATWCRPGPVRRPARAPTGTPTNLATYGGRGHTLGLRRPQPGGVHGPDTGTGDAGPPVAGGDPQRGADPGRSHSPPRTRARRDRGARRRLLHVLRCHRRRAARFHRRTDTRRHEAHLDLGVDRQRYPAAAAALRQR